MVAYVEAILKEREDMFLGNLVQIYQAVDVHLVLAQSRTSLEIVVVMSEDDLGV